MLKLMNNWFGSPANPIGVDFGTDSLRLAQVQMADGEARLVAAASADVPSHARHEPAARLAFFVQTTRDLLAQGEFRGRRAVLALPAASMFIQHLRLPKMDEEATRKALPWEARGKLPIDPSHALLRHIVAGEIYQDQEAKNEVILMAASREMVTQFLDAAGRARLDVVGMTVEPTAVTNCFAHIYRRKSDAGVTNCFVDMGYTATRAFITRGTQILFARSIPIGGEHFTRAAANAMKLSVEDAKLLRLRLSHTQPAATQSEEKQQIAPEPAIGQEFAVLGAALAAAERRGSGVGSGLSEQAASSAASVLTGGEGGRGVSPLADQRRDAAATVAIPPVGAPAAPVTQTAPDMSEQLRQVDQACREPLGRLVEELDLCRRYYEATFANQHVDRLIFIGGEARHRTLCQYVAQQMGLAAQIGDPLVRMGRTSEVGIESGIDRRQPQPAWAVAIGLSLGPA